MVGLVLFNMVSAKDEFDLFKIASILEHENVSIHKWSLHSREILETVQTKQEAVHKVDQLRKRFNHWDWNISEDDDKWEARADFTPKKDVNESIRVMQTVTDRQVQTYIVYEVKGKGWNEETREFIEGSILNRINDIFHENVKIFSCLFSELDGNMNESVSASVTRLLQAFQAKEVETLKEKNFVSTTSYSPLFSEAIQGETEQMNLQLGFRNQGMGGKTTLVVGTPIITIEY